jgi:hypothetical protein
VIEVPPGQLYLGEIIEDHDRKKPPEPVLLPRADLTTHGVIVGMTGSGKTGLGIALIEEALLSGVPTLVLDPKGDLGNLLLTFPSLTPEDFAPWVESGDPALVANQWKDGLASWGIDADRMQKLRDAASFTIYTPGSTSGVPLNIVGSLHAPADLDDLELLQDEVEGFVSGLLGLVNIDADPLASREYILLANLVQHAWTNGHDLDLATLVGQVQSPPLRKLGVFELDTFFPEADRMKLAMKLNGLLASPAFAAWSQGSDLDVASLLGGEGDKPRCAIVELAHLSDEERQFVVTLVLTKLVTWMRRQPGTSDLRVLVYFDEILGFAPPTAMPPAKKPILALLKQARAFGVGLVVATQNPIDLDYKALANAGTWMVGRLQTEQDKGRLLSGMSAASGGVDVKAVSDTIGGLGKREFVLRRSGKDTPEVFTSRWAMSYLRGPLTREQISRLMADRKGTTAAPAVEPAAPATPTVSADDTEVAPKVADGVPVRFLSAATPWVAEVGGLPGSSRLAPAVVARAQLSYDDTKADLRHTEEWEAVLFPLREQPDASEPKSVDYDERDFIAAPPPGVRYTLPDAPIATTAWFTKLQKSLVDHLVQNRTADVFRNKALKLFSRPGETREQFLQRCDAAADVEADRAGQALTAKYQERIARARQAINVAVDRVAETRSMESNRRTQEVISDAGSVIGSLFGGRKSARSIGRTLSGAASRRSQSSAASRRVDTARNRLDDKQQALADLEADLADKVRDLADDWDQKAAAIDDVHVPLERTDIQVTDLAIVWLPVA